MLRTQIYLPEKLRREIDKQRAQTGESLSDYVRKAAEKRVQRNKKRKKSAQAVIREVLASMDPKKSGWRDVDVLEWQREIREDRD